MPKVRSEGRSRTRPQTPRYGRARRPPCPVPAWIPTCVIATPHHHTDNDDHNHPQPPTIAAATNQPTNQQLVLNPADAELFLPKLLPRLEAAATETADPECRSVCAAATATVKRAVSEGPGASAANEDNRKTLSTEEASPGGLGGKGGGGGPWHTCTCTYAHALVLHPLEHCRSRGWRLLGWALMVQASAPHPPHPTFSHPPRCPRFLLPPP